MATKRNPKKRALRVKRRIKIFMALIVMEIIGIVAVIALNANEKPVVPDVPVGAEKPGMTYADTVSLAQPGSGDLDGDGSVTSEDAGFALKASVGLEILSDSVKAAVDMNRDGRLTVGDVRSIMRISAGLGLPESPSEFFCPALTEKNIPENAKVIYLTFDDGPSANTVEILEILERYNVKATFFVIKNTEKPQLYREIVNKGHSIALHTSSHKYNRIYASTEAYFEDLQNISDYVYENAGVRTRLIRFPGGSSNTISKSYCSGIMSALVKATAERGYVYFDWNSSNNDALGKPQSVEQMKNAATAYTEKSPLIMLMHDAPGKEKTVQALPGIIEHYKNAGYYFLPLNENSPTAHHGVAN